MFCPFTKEECKTDCTMYDEKQMYYNCKIHLIASNTGYDHSESSAINDKLDEVLKKLDKIIKNQQ